jgi:hypothetical protein
MLGAGRPHIGKFHSKLVPEEEERIKSFLTKLFSALLRDNPLLFLTPLM